MLTKPIAVLCNTAVWIYAMWIYANAELNGFGLASILVMAIFATVGIALVMAADPKGSSDKATKEGEESDE